MEIKEPKFGRDINVFNLSKGAASQKDVPINPEVSSNDQPAADVFISEEGYRALREELEQSGTGSTIYMDQKNYIEKVKEQAKVEDGSKELQVIWDLCNEMMEMGNSKEHGKREINDLEIVDLMKSAMETYEKVYDRLIQKHEDGDRWIDYGGIKKCMTLEEDLAALDEAYKLYTERIGGYAGIQQNNKHWEQLYHKEYKYFYQQVRKHRDSEIQIPNRSADYDGDYHYLDEGYKKTLTAMMEEGRKQFLSLVGTSQYRQGMAVGIMSRLINSDKDFLEKTKKLFAK